MFLIPYVRRSEVPAVSRLFDELFNDFPFTSSLADGKENWIPSVDVLEKEGNIVLRVELPGMNEKEIELKVEGDTLILKGERKMASEDNKSNYHRIERSYGSFTRSFRLPDTVDSEKIEADYKTGVLTITIPKKPEVKPREIPVKVQ
jgi:HSP20 family protein